MKKSFNIQKKIAPQVQLSLNQAHAPPRQELSRTPRTRPKASQFSGSRNYKTKQTSFIDTFKIILQNT
jgi:hypothetical protein